MSNIPALSGKKMIKALTKANFSVIRIKGSHHFLAHPDGRKTVIPVHGNETIGKGLFAQILRDCDLTVYEFLDLL
ncbi:type II toxin-antitoxin system HicA family toxin [Geminocystis sp. GBBB08]|uniref:type II toxin-antitoxin system HicA family toxin n=1 Tax=Geminocystis sp. GBBB08 TaxID=2604140 RepID=UPI0027E33A6B|nr:type II toxin-antitoxin system HicA family toxin [Geminocystis sp. GBBB08]MBL1211363.1 type II toxin-antitoxin system HicA family toxin [Geminocystis sp. GBBB08]